MKKNVEQDLSLVEIIKNGDKRQMETAVNELYKKYYKVVLFRYKNMYKNNLDVEDLVTEAFGKCFTNIHTFRGENAAFSTWLFSITKNLFIDALRKPKQDVVSLSDMTNHDDEDSEANDFDVQSTDLDPETSLIKEQRKEQIALMVEKALEDKPHLKYIFDLKYFQELSYEEIVHITDFPLNTIKGQLFRAREVIQKFMAKNNITF